MLKELRSDKKKCLFQENESKEQSYRGKCFSLKNKIKKIELENNILSVEIESKKKILKRLLNERNLLINKVEECFEKKIESCSFVEVDEKTKNPQENQKEVFSITLKELYSPFHGRMDRTGIRRPIHAFSWYCQDQLKERKEHVNSLKSIIAQLRRSWIDLELLEKEKYFILYEKDKKRFQREITEQNKQF